MALLESIRGELDLLYKRYKNFPVQTPLLGTALDCLLAAAWQVVIIICGPWLVMLHEASLHTQQWMMSSGWSSLILLCFQFSWRHTRTLATLPLLPFSKQLWGQKFTSRFPPVKLVVWFLCFMIRSVFFFLRELFVLLPLLFAFHPKYATTRVFSRPVWLTAP